jgi:hypothetical protein
MTEAEARRKIAKQQMRLADECVADAEAAAARGSGRLVWNRAYYACFHAATAVFIARDRAAIRGGDEDRSRGRTAAAWRRVAASSGEALRIMLPSGEDTGAFGTAARTARLAVI